MLGSLSSSDSKAVWELKEILNNNIAARSKAESDKVVSTHLTVSYTAIYTMFSYKVLSERMDQLEEMLNKKEKFLQVCIKYFCVHMP